MDEDEEFVGGIEPDFAGDFEGKPAEHAGVGAEEFSVKPYVALMVHAVEDQVEAAVLQRLRDGEGFLIPPVLFFRLIDARVGRAIGPCTKLFEVVEVGLHVAWDFGRHPFASCQIGGDGISDRHRAFAELPISAAEQNLSVRFILRKQRVGGEHQGGKESEGNGCLFHQKFRDW